MSDSLKTDRNIDKHLHMLKTESGEISSLSVSTEGNGVKVTGDLNVTGDIKTPHQSTPVSDFDLATKKYVDDNAGGSYYYETKCVGWNNSGTSAVYLPINGYIIEFTGTASRNEYLGYVAPYNGTIERAMFRCETAQDGTLEFDIYESSDGTENPGSVSGVVDTVIDIADDTSVTIDFSSMTSGTNALVKGRIYAFRVDTPAAPHESNMTLVFKWDITT